VTPLTRWTTFQINRKKLREILDYLAGLANADWYIDANGYLHYFFRFPIILRLLGSQLARDFVTTFPAAHGPLQVVRGWYRHHEQVEIVGGTYLGQ